jgi:rubredoxin
MLKPMDPDVIRALLADTEDVITPAVKAEEQLYKHLRCPVCGGSKNTKVLRPIKVVHGEGGPVILNSPFGDDVLPEGRAKCLQCGAVYDPYTKVVERTEASMIASPDSDPLPK